MSTTTLINSPSFGRFSFDAVFRADHMSSVTVTQHPVQTGASVSDHAYSEPDEVTLEIGMSDAAVSAGTNHSVNAYAQLRAIMSKREPVTLVTRLHSYKNMVITSMSAPDDYMTMNALKATIYFRQIEMVSVSTVTVQQQVSASASGQSGAASGAASSGNIKANASSSTSQTSAKKQSVLSKAKSAAKKATTTTTTRTATNVSNTVKAKIKALSTGVSKALKTIKLK